MTDHRVIFSEQYCCPCIVPPQEYDAQQIIQACVEAEATFQEEPGEPSYVVQLRDEIGPELWTAEALRRTDQQKAK
jgi:hypothetical protein